MAQIDFAVAFVVIFIMISYATFFVSNALTGDFEHYETKKLEASRDSLANQLFKNLDSNSLMTSLKRTQIVFEDVGGYTHTETLNISFEPAVSDVHVYNLTMGEIASDVSDGAVSFELGFAPGMKSHITIIHSGSAENVSYASNITANNITAVILSESDVLVLSQEKCSDLQSISYSESKSNLGMENHFRIDSHCVYGENTPEAGNIIVRNIPVMIENASGAIYTDYITLKVW
ncbi:MAG: hypothetical protein V1818_00055 [Candidatus Aenigmatarchaeota archaeon]